MTNAEIGQAIKTRRTYLKIGQQELADLAEVGINTIVAIERGTGNARLQTLLKVCEALGLTLNIEL